MARKAWQSGGGRAAQKLAHYHGRSKIEIKRHTAWALLLERAALEVSRVFGEPTELRGELAPLLRPIEKKPQPAAARGALCGQILQCTGSLALLAVCRLSP